MPRDQFFGVSNHIPMIPDEWHFAYQLLKPSVKIQYSPTGSGAGRTAIYNNRVEFAGSDSPMSSSDRTRVRNTFVTTRWSYFRLGSMPCRRLSFQVRPATRSVSASRTFVIPELLYALAIPRSCITSSELPFVAPAMMSPSLRPLIFSAQNFEVRSFPYHELAHGQFPSVPICPTTCV
jgi:hypothetical protein